MIHCGFGMAILRSPQIQLVGYGAVFLEERGLVQALPLEAEPGGKAQAFGPLEREAHREFDDRPYEEGAYAFLDGPDEGLVFPPLGRDEDLDPGFPRRDCGG